MLDISVPLHARLLAPVLPVVWVLIVAMFWNLARARWRRRWIRVVAVIGVIALAVPVLVWHARGARDTYHAARLGGGIFAKFNRLAPPGPMVVAMRGLPRRAFVFTDAPEKAYRGSGRFATMIPQRVSRFSGSENPRYESDLAEVGRILCGHPGVVALFATRADQQHPLFLGYRREIERLGHLELVESFDDGLLLGADATRCRAG